MADRGTAARRSRREYLASIGAGATGLLAGCTELARSVGEPADAAEVEDAESVLHWSYVADPWRDDDPGKMTWFGTGAFPGPSEPIGPRGGYHRPRPMWDMTMALEVWGGWLDDFVKTGAIEYGLYESVDVEPDRIEITIREDARWSNGDEVLGRDAVSVLMAARMTDNAATPPDELAPDGPSTPLDAVTDFEWDGKRATLHSDGGWFDGFLEERLCASLARGGPDGAGSGSTRGSRRTTSGSRRSRTTGSGRCGARSTPGRTPSRCTGGSRTPSTPRTTSGSDASETRPTASSRAPSVRWRSRTVGTSFSSRTPSSTPPNASTSTRSRSRGSRTHASPARS